jgi:outer membrane protein TolC
MFEDACADRTMAQAALNRLMDDAPDSPVGPVSRLTDLGPTLSTLDAQALGDLAVRNGPRIAVRRGQAEAGAARVEVARQECRTICPKVIAAEHQAEAAKLDLATASAESRAEVVCLLTAWRRAQEQVAAYETALVIQSHAAFDAARTGYLGGGNDFATVLDAFKQWLEVQLELAHSMAHRFMVRSRVALLAHPPAGGRWPHAAGDAAGRPRVP